MDVFPFASMILELENCSFPIEIFIVFFSSIFPSIFAWYFLVIFVLENKIYAKEINCLIEKIIRSKKNTFKLTKVQPNGNSGNSFSQNSKGKINIVKNKLQQGNQDGNEGNQRPKSTKQFSQNKSSNTSANNNINISSSNNKIQEYTNGRTNYGTFITTKKLNLDQNLETNKRIEVFNYQITEYLNHIKMSALRTQ